MFREAEIESVSAVRARDSAVPGGEGVDEPGQLGQLFRVQELQVGFGDGLGRHRSIILKIWTGGLKPSFLAAGGGTAEAVHPHSCSSEVASVCGLLGRGDIVLGSHVYRFHYH